MEKSVKVEKYEEFLNEVLREDLRKELDARNKLLEDIASHSQLKQIVHCVKETDPSTGFRTQVDLGCNFYAQAHIPDPSKIYVKIGLDVHLEMSLEEAADYCDQKLKILHKAVSESGNRTAKIKAKMKFMELALAELQGIALSDSESGESRRNFMAL